MGLELILCRKITALRELSYRPRGRNSLACVPCPDPSVRRASPDLNFQ